MAGCSLVPDRGGHDRQLPRRGVGLHRTGCPDPDERVGTELDQLLDRDRGRRASDSGRHDAHLLAVETSRPGRVLPVRGDVGRVIEQCGDRLAATWVTRKQNVSTDIAGPQLDVVLHVLVV